MRELTVEDEHWINTTKTVFQIVVPASVWGGQHAAGAAVCHRSFGTSGEEEGAQGKRHAQGKGQGWGGSGFRGENLGVLSSRMQAN